MWGFQYECVCKVSVRYPLRIKKALGIFRELITARRRTTIGWLFWDPPSGSNKYERYCGPGSECAQHL